ncbi:MAG TPA: glycosyltransferase family A protein [Pyrinomonadaceae bacterium]
MPRISVIIPTHNRPHLLIRAIESARAAATDVEIIVVDDASTDNTAEVCGQLAGIKHVRVERNQGVAGARNIGIFESSAQYIAFLDDDDLRAPGSLDLQADVLDRDPGAGFVCGAMIMADQDYQATGEIIRPRHISGDAFWSLLELDFPVMPLCALIRKECFLRVGLLDRNISSIDDWDMFTRIAELYPVTTIQEAVGIYRQPTPSSAQGSSARAAQLQLAARHQLKLLRLPRVAGVPLKERRLIRKRTINRVCDHLIWNAGKNHLPAGKLRPAAANIAVALKLDPLIPLRPSEYQKVARKLSERFRGFSNL